MIVILVGDANKKRVHAQTLVLNRDVISITAGTLSKELLSEHATSASLFGEVPVVTGTDLLKEGKSIFSVEILSMMKDSPATFIFLEDKLLVADEKKFAKYATITHFDSPKTTATPKINTFAIADAYGKRDKVAAWVLYCQAIEKGTEPEAISGMLFWKIKTMIQNGSRVFTVEDLKRQSGSPVP
jgi:hypothetical protein